VSSINILLVNEHEIMREGLKLMLNAQPDLVVVGEVCGVHELRQNVRSLQPHVVIVDLSMPVTNGFQVARQLKAENSEVRILALSAYEDADYLQQMLNAGASGYLLKRAAASDLIRAIHMVAQNQIYIDPLMAHAWAKQLISPVYQERADASDPPVVSAREKEVLRLFVWGYAHKEIAREMHISVKTVETYKARLMEKMNFKSRTELVRFALKEGLFNNDPGRS
jgi:two-component system response regulator NreC